MKHRSDADALIEGGHVRLNRVRVTKTGHALKEGDVLTLTLYRGVRVVKVLGTAERRGPAVEARSLYEELTENSRAGQDQACYQPPSMLKPEHHDLHRL